MNRLLSALLLASAMTLAALLLTGSTVYAQTNDWTSGPPPDDATCRRVDSKAQNSHATANFIICWKGTDVWVSPAADDKKSGDSRGAAAQISYFVKINGKWREHRRLAAFDHTPDGEQTAKDFFKSRYPITRLLARACLSKPNQRNTVDGRTCDAFR